MQTALYRAFSGDGRLLYVGVTDRLDGRLRDHWRRSPWWDPDGRVDAEWFESRQHALDAEGVAIRIERPAWNRTHLSGYSSSFIIRHWRPSSAEQSAAVQRLMQTIRRVAFADDPHWYDAKDEARAVIAEALASGVPARVVARLSRCA